MEYSTIQTESSSLLQSFINHIVLPPRLPGKQDGRLDQIESALTQRLIDACGALTNLTGIEFHEQWNCLRFSLQACKVLNAGGKICKAALLTELGCLQQKALLILHISEQNSGLLIRRHQDLEGETVVFEAFEASPLSREVLSSKNALLWDFPGSAVAIPWQEFNRTSFQENLAVFLEQASVESIKRFAAQTGKAGSLAFESRDTVDPSLITQMLMTLLEVNGRRISTPLLRKRIRDDVCWASGAETPWRRIPFWLVLRVAIQRHLSVVLGSELGRVYYKFFICFVLARLLDESVNCLAPEMLNLLKAKLCRRLSKMEVDKEKSPPIVRNIYDGMFKALSPIFHKVIQNATVSIEALWETFKATTQRPVLPLPWRATQRDLYLTLPNSGAYLQKVLNEPLLQTESQGVATHRMLTNCRTSAPTANPFRAFAQRYFSLSGVETDIENYSQLPVEFGESPCITLANKIQTYLDSIKNAYDADPEQSSTMVLSAMELWCQMDKSAVKTFALLGDYNPGFLLEMLDVLHLPDFKDMQRLQEVQIYLQDRHTKCKYRQTTIFSDLVKGCFAEMFFNESEQLHKLYERIESVAERARAEKEKEWQSLSDDYEDLTKAIAQTSCLYTTDERNPLVTVHDDLRCKKCYLDRKARRIRICIHEHPLPSNPVQAKAVIFELLCPRPFSLYRDATWKILGTLAKPKRENFFEPRVLLPDYSQLKKFITTTKADITLASKTKSFLDTHYSHARFPIPLGKVCLPNGLSFSYFDTVTERWPGKEAQKPTFSHHCEMEIPVNSPFSSLQSLPHFKIEACGPSSYEVVESQTRCPPGLSAHEFMAYQSLFSGRHRRWPAILIELGSSNLNFSTEATSILMSRLALQAGPSYKSDPLRAIHRIFRDEPFCNKLVDQLSQRLEGVSSNWRETNCMEMLVSLAIRLFSLTPNAAVRNAAVKFLEKARIITFKWTEVLRQEMCRDTDANVAQKHSKYAFWAALLCKRTFAIYITDETGMEPEALRYFIECSIVLRDNLVDDPSLLPGVLRKALIRDLKATYRMRFVLRRIIETNPYILMTAINNVRPGAEGSLLESVSEWGFLEPPEEWWIGLSIEAQQHTVKQTLQYNLLEGCLLVNSQPAGKLPAKYRRSRVLVELFDDLILSTSPSGQRGMSYMLATNQVGHQVHVGFRAGVLFVRAYGRTKMELIPREEFRGLSGSDLPAPLIDDCFHWLDLDTGLLHVRKKPCIWKDKSSNWSINTRTRLATRRQVSLVDPHSQLFRRVANILDRFENREQLTVYQPIRKRLSVELRRLELSFTVNNRNLLQSRELQSEIDPDQDAGTWYGLNSKLVLRDLKNPCQRSIIVPLGTVQYKRNGLHVSVSVENRGEAYGRFTINTTLGRLDCPAEPRLLYSKAQFHAYTSFLIPDSLTGRTGTEESLHCLRSAYCQPWVPLRRETRECLESISKLSPRRCYYPESMKVMQEVHWDKELTTTIQHEGFLPLIKEICRKSEQLSIFASQWPEGPNLGSEGDGHLFQRGFLRRQLYERLSLDTDGQEMTSDLAYCTRDRIQIGQRRLNVLESASLILKWKCETPKIPQLARILESWPVIGGIDRSFDKILLSDILDLDIPLEWGSLVNLCRSSNRVDRFRLAFLFGAISFDDETNMDVIRILVAFAVLEDLKALKPPGCPVYIQFRRSELPEIDSIVQLTDGCCTPYPEDERTTLGFCLGSKERKRLEALELAHKMQAEEDSKALASFLLRQWPCFEPVVEGIPTPPLLNVNKAMEAIGPWWERLFQNWELSCFVDDAQLILNKQLARRSPPVRETGLLVEPDEEWEPFPTRSRGLVVPSLRDLLRRADHMSYVEIPEAITCRNPVNACTMLQDRNMPHGLRTPPKPLQARPEELLPSAEIRELESIITNITKSRSAVRQHYGQDLLRSLNALKALRSAPGEMAMAVDLPALPSAISKARRILKEHSHNIQNFFERGDPRAQWLKRGGLWPPITPVSLLEQLRTTYSPRLEDCMKVSLTSYGLCITALQRLMRMEDASLKNNYRKLEEEQKNVGHCNWKPLDYPDWLLLEIDANILIRPEQVDVAIATISPVPSSNSVLQMNMGQGKTSCIIPMVAAVLADAEKLVRIIIPKSLLPQTAQLLQGRIGGLLGRELRHVPFSRKTLTKPKIIKTFRNIHQDIIESSGVMLALPEHILSFKLSGLQRLSDSRLLEASQMIEVQDWLTAKARDVLDESDVTLAVRTQLIYPSGTQQAVDGHPHRWEVSQILLGLVGRNVEDLVREYPQSIEVVWRDGGFPFIHFLRLDVENALISKLVDDVCNGRVQAVPIRECSKPDRLAIRTFIADAKVPKGVVERIRQIFPDKPAAKLSVYLLRGLLVHRMLLLTLKKRWNINYGLHPERNPVAIPYLAKGVPSEQSEFGHPDCAILLTCLAFYYGGVSKAQVRQSLENILKSDDPQSQYERWTQDSSLPDSLREWNAINVDDGDQLTEIWQNVSFNVVVIDYFLNSFVFPKYSKQFEVKLQASGWDIPLTSKTNHPPADTLSNSQPLTTGFSGTNDNKTLLPLTIRQGDLNGLEATNAEVLTYLLQGRNRGYVLAADWQGRRLSEPGLLKKLKLEGIKILIDAGAQILEMDNITLVKTWLDIEYEVPAAVYFDTDNKPIVIYRQGLQMPLLASPFAEDLTGCLVYLDEAHTRGTDLKLPPESRGALTLGPGQTKDHTVQAAMRLRQLATTQSVSFFAPPEVHQSILDVRKKEYGEHVDSSDVICWLLEQTCCGIEQLQPLYYSQGVDFCRRTQAAQDNPQFLTHEGHRTEYLTVLRQKEQQTLAQLYMPRTKTKPVEALGSLSGKSKAYMETLHDRRKGFQDTGSAVHGSALQEVEQEREVAHEAEAVREVQKPVRYSPLSFPGLHKDIRSFVQTGNRAIIGCIGYEHAFAALQNTSLGRKFGISSAATTSRLYVSSQFMKTVMTSGRANDNFQRPVNWILWSPLAETAIIIIPEEAELVIPLLYNAKLPRTHLLTYAAPVTKRMLHFNGLNYYAIPSLPKEWKAPEWLMTELGIFAGRLYFQYEEYDRLCRFLGCRDEDIVNAPKAEKIVLSDELYGTSANEISQLGMDGRALKAQSFTAKPLTFLQEWLAIRRKDQDFTHTPMGYVCQGRPLTEDHHFFRKAENFAATDTRIVRGRGAPSEGSTHGEDFSSNDELFDETCSSSEVDTFSEVAGDIELESGKSLADDFP